LNPYRRKLAATVEQSLHADNRVQLQQCEGRRRIVESCCAASHSVYEVRRQCVGVNLEPESGRRERRHSRAYAAICAAGDRLMQAKESAPGSFTPERVEAEDLPAITYKLGRMIADSGVISLRPFVAAVAISPEKAAQKYYRSERQS
jgi:hypothetical protein